MVENFLTPNTLGGLKISLIITAMNVFHSRFICTLKEKHDFLMLLNAHRIRDCTYLIDWGLK